MGEVLHKTAQAISLGLTPAAIVLASMVVYYWWDSFKESVKKPHDKRVAIDWFIIGVAISFMGSVVDNFYWGLAWASSYIDSEYRHALFSNGVYFNIFSRQLSSIIAAYCHVKAAIAHGTTKQRSVLDKVLYSTCIFGFAFVVALHTIKALSLFE